MKKGGSRSILRIRTFDEDVARVRGTDTSTIPKVKKEKVTAQSTTDTILKNSTHTATDFIASNKDRGNITIEKQIEEKTTSIENTIPPLPEPKSSIEIPEIPSVHSPAPSKIETQKIEEAIQEIESSDVHSVLTAEGAVYDVSNNDLGEGTIITNKKRKGFKLFPAIIASVQSWFGNKKEQHAQEQQPTHTVNKAESRLETITAAARESKHAPQSDYGIVVKRLKKKKRNKKKTEITIKKKKETAAPQWSSSVDFIDEPAYIPPAQTPPNDTVVTPPIPEPEPVLAKEIIAPKPAPQTEQLNTQPQPSPQPEKPVQKNVPQGERKYRAVPHTQSRVPLYIFMLVIVGASLLGIGVSVYWFMSSTPQEEAVIIRTSTLFTAQTKVPVPLTSDRKKLLSTILDLSLASRETTLLYPTIENDTLNDSPADVRSILNALAFRAPGSFTRAITEITFGGYNGTDPFILMKVTNFDTAFGGILEWEPDMSTDLSPLFGIPVSQSYDPYARTDTQIRSAFFRDTVVANKSVRLLVDAQDNQRLMYAFVTPTIILITPNEDTFKAVLPLVTQ